MLNGPQTQTRPEIFSVDIKSRTLSDSEQQEVLLNPCPDETL